ncbi:UDP-galactose translocator [Seminavis robusta]|uniref:UDP-galactose translocator n=1 Tax=Seminavis robusta TaxID=568900 RepID=A0A9N8DJI3_9STRA|nr:UDP-galactose translocator [Seminavis robusta]|eukprot:Sro93_g048660.1 UDP-galactose translocator (436) ;mRNA; f:98664-99971
MNPSNTPVPIQSSDIHHGKDILRSTGMSDGTARRVTASPSTKSTPTAMAAKTPSSDGANHVPASASKADRPVTTSQIQTYLSVTFKNFLGFMSGMKMLVLVILCLQNSIFTVLRRYSQGVLRESYSKHEVLLVGEIIKMAFSAWMISKSLPEDCPDLKTRLQYLVDTSKKMFILALIYGAMNILSFVSLRNIGAGMFTIFAQCKIMTTATCSAIILKRSYSWARWRALISLMMGVLLFSEPIWGNPDNMAANEGGNALVGTAAVLIEVTLSGFASIYFEKVIKTDPLQLGIWERNFQLALSSCPVYLAFMLFNRGGEAGLFGGWSLVSFMLSLLGAAGGLLVALSIKYGDSILKTLATTGAIILSSLLDHYLLGGPLTAVMMIAGVQVIISICNYTFDATPVEPLVPEPVNKIDLSAKTQDDVEEAPLISKSTSE